MNFRYNNLVLLVTTLCDQKCARCCYRLGFAQEPKRRHFEVEEILQDAELFRGLNTIYISGGEPTLHPDLASIISLVRKAMRPKRICLATHGYSILDHLDAVQRADWVLISPNKGGPARAKKLRKACPGISVGVDKRDHREIPLKQYRENAGPCRRVNMPVYVNGRLYPCCVSYGLPGAQYILPEEDWREKLSKVPIPCGWCAFSKE